MSLSIDDDDNEDDDDAVAAATNKRWGDRLRVRKCEEEEKMCGGSTHLEAGELCTLYFTE